MIRYQYGRSDINEISIGMSLIQLQLGLANTPTHVR